MDISYLNTTSSRIIIINKPIRWFRGLGLWNPYLRDKIWYEVLQEKLKGELFDISICQGEFLLSTIKYSEKENIKSVIFIRAFENFKNRVKLSKSNPVKSNFLKKIINLSARNAHFKMNKEAVESADMVIANSRFMKSMIDSEFGVDSSVVYPFIYLDDYQIKNKTGKKILFVKPTYKKGVEIFIKIAKALPQNDFLCVGSAKPVYKNILESLPNVTYLGWIDNMKDIYARSNLLLAPSIWNEPFGRVAVEAMASGIPVIASNKGGLQEVVEEAGILIDDIYSIKSWCKEIELLLENETLYDNMVKGAVAKARKFNAESQFEKIDVLLKRLVSL